MNIMDKSAIHEMTLQARQILTSEIEEMLQGVYGLDSRHNFAKEEKIPALREMPELLQTRRRLDKRLADEVSAGLSRAEAAKKLVKEAAFTHLNRLVALRMMERRGLIEGTLERYQDSRGFLFYLAEPEHAEDLRLYETGGLARNALGESARDVAFRHFLLHQFSLLSQEIRVLFDPDDLASRLFPRPRSLKALVELLSRPELEAAWGEEETIGWIYQYFNEQEKADVFNRLYKKKQKIRPEDIPAATQLFTPRWIVKFLVQNTLGRQWMQMHPDSRLGTALDYLVPLAGEIPPEKMKPVREIEVLDPACGTMHFGLVAFDLLAEMYREEIEMAGGPGWPAEPSVASEQAIPAAILANNIFGIDIDLRAVQLSALALYLKAKSCNPEAKITESHLACAELRLPEDARLEAFLRASKFTLPVYERIIRRLWSVMRGGSGIGAGSLLPLEGAITAEVERERRAHLSSLQRFQDMAEAPEEEARTAAWGPEFWDVLEDQIARYFDFFAKEQAALGGDESYFVGEASKGMHLLDIMRRRYDCVFTNPPYLHRRNMFTDLAEFLEANYPEAKGDLYTAFIRRCQELTKDFGRFGLLTIHSFMFISSHEKLREDTSTQAAIESGCHLGPKSEFEISNPNAQGFVAFTCRKGSEEVKLYNPDDEWYGTWYRLIKAEGEAKKYLFEKQLAGQAEDVFIYPQANFNSIPGSPWVYWITPGLRQMFVGLPKLGEIAPPRQGLATADNFRFLRYWWEAGGERIGFGCRNQVEAQASEKTWLPYMKGGSFRRWYGNQEYIINWERDGEELRSLAPISVIRNPNFYFCRGVTYSFLTSARFSARLSPGGFIFDVAGSSLFPENISLILAIMNSSFAAYALKLINPTVNFQVGDLARLPIPKESSKQLEHLVERAISLAMQDSAEDETTFDFIAPPWTASLDDTTTVLFLREDALKDVERDIDEEVYRLYGISDEDRRAIEAELAEPQAEGEEANEPDYIDEEELARRWISYAVGIVMGRFQPDVGDLGQGRFSQPVAAELRSLTDSDGVATLMEGHQDDLAAKVWRALQIALGEDGATEVVEAALGYDSPEEMLRRYLEKDFFKLHLQKYRKRPVYWLLQSAGKAFSVYIFHERATRDTLPLILGSRYVGGMINHLKSRQSELEEALKTAQGREKKQLEKEEAKLDADLQDLQRFEAALRRVLERKNERGETAGWTLEIDDGVILNLAPLAELMPAWKEPDKFWRALETGEYDWSRTAMRYWPDRVLDKCRKNKSYAIAHGRMDVYEG
jgi:type I restriction-modification system DNA methylase subunit